MSKILTFLRLSLHEKINTIDLLWAKIKTVCFYRPVFKEIGSGSILKNPMFLKNANRISLGDGVFIRDGGRLEVIGEGKIVIEEGVGIEQRCHVTSAGEVRIGKHTTVLFDVMITDIDHAYQALGVSIAKQPLLVRPTVIGENCFIGSGAKIQAGSRLGKQCIVGANAVVRGVFPDYCVIVGVPAKIVKRYRIETATWEKTNGKGEFLDGL